MNWRAAIPNALTLCNLACGFAALVTAASAQYEWAILFICLAALCDVLDGAVARLLGVASALGVQLDSLADVVSFGVAPAFLLYQVARVVLGDEGSLVLFLFCSILPLAAAYRLARFNVEADRQLPYFEGLPSPAAGLIIVSESWLLSQPTHGWLTSQSLIGSHVLVMCVLVGFSMVSRYPYLSFKGKRWTYLAAVAVIVILGYFLLRPLAALVAVLWYGLVSRFAHRTRPTHHAAQ